MKYWIRATSENNFVLELIFNSIASREYFKTLISEYRTDPNSIKILYEEGKNLVVRINYATNKYVDYVLHLVRNNYERSQDINKFKVFDIEKALGTSLNNIK